MRGLSSPATIEGVNRLLASAALLPVLALGACSEAERIASDAASDAGSRASCAVAGAAVDEGRGLVEGIAADIGADPDSVDRRLTVAREAVAAAERGLDGEVRQQLDRAVQALDALRDEARAVADGSSVDELVVAEAQAEYDVAAQQIAGVC